MPDGLYERDILAWADRQAGLLRRLASGERLNDAIDWPNVIEEVQDLGRSELRACSSLVEQAMVYMLKLHLWPDSPAAAHWRGETVAFLTGARRAFSPSMRPRLDLPELYLDAVLTVRAGAERPEELPAALPSCPWVLDDLLSREPDAADLAARLSSSMHYG